MEETKIQVAQNGSDVEASSRNENVISNNKNIPAGYVQVSNKFALLNKLITRDLNSYTEYDYFALFKKRDIIRFLRNPKRYEKQLRKAVRYMYDASPHFRRLIQYFTGLSDLSYIVEPYRIDPRKSNVRIINNNYRKCLNMVSSIGIKTQIPKVLTVCLREDVFYCTMWITSDNITLQQLPSDYCSISSIEGNVLNVTFDFSYFSTREHLLNNFPPEFRTKYEIFKRGDKTVRGRRWIELDSPTSFAIKCNVDILDYAIPPFVGILREIYDIEDYKILKMTKTELENYAMIAMRLPMTEDGSWGIDLDKARDFWSNLDAVLPDEIGSVLTPMALEKISFERNAAGDNDTIAEAEQNLFTAAGVSSLLFNNEKASANALLLSIKVDQALTYGIVKSVGDAINRFLQAQNYGRYFRVNFLDVSPFNRKEVGDAYLKAASYGLPTISAYAASQGIGQAELDAMSYLEGEVLGLHSLFRPLMNSSQMSSSNLDSEAPTDEGGRPQSETGDLSDSGEQTREDSDDWG